MIEIFKTGTHTAMGGVTIEFNASDIEATARAYDPAKHEAPLVAGHPKHDKPAYGWVKALAFSEGVLRAEPDQVDPAFSEMVSAGRFKKISASFYAPDSPNNPCPGVYYLRHVGFLGAQPPAVKGLRDASFSDAEEGVIEFSDYSDAENAGLWRRMREWIIGKFGLDEADKVIPNYSVGALEAEARQEAEPSQLAPAYAEHNPPTPETNTVTPEKAAALEAENTQLKQHLAAADARDKAAKAEELHARNLAFAEKLVAGGKLLPTQKDVAVTMLDVLASQETPVEFGEGDNKQTLIGAFQSLLEALPKQVEFGEIVTPRDHDAATVSFAAPPGYIADAEKLEEHNRVCAYMAQHKTDYLTAAKAVGGPQP